MSTPIITAIYPSTGDIAGNLAVLITGSDFQTGATVLFGGVPSTTVIVADANNLTALSPAHVVGVVNIEIINPDLGAHTLVGAFTYFDGASVDYSFTTEEVQSLPIAIIAPASQDAVVGGVVRLDGRSSYSSSGSDLTYRWSFSQIPIGSQVEGDGFQELETDSSVVSFAPDVTGLYIIQLIVNDGSFDSIPATTEVNTKAVLVPQNLGIVPDMSWVWNLLSDFWTRVEGRARFETFWSTAIQVIAAEQLKLWQYDYNKSIKDIQEVIQRRWIAYEPQLELDASQTTFILADDQAGLNASTFLIDTASNLPAADQPLKSNLITVPKAEGDFALTTYGQPISLGRVVQLDKTSFTLGRTGIATRAVGRGTNGGVVGASNIVTAGALSTGMQGMIVKFLSGALSGLSYLIDIVMSSTAMTVTQLNGSPVVFASPVSGMSYAIFPVTANYNSFFADQLYVPTRQAPLPWRFSPTLVSKEYDFEALGVSPGDVLTVQVKRTDSNLTSTLNVQIVSADRSRVGFVFNTLDLVDGTPAKGISRDDQIKLAQDLQVTGLMVSTSDNSLVYTDQALQIATTVQTAAFKRKNFESALSWETEIDVGPFSVTITPIKIIRNSKILVDANIRSVPSLQEYVRQPTIIDKGGELFQVSESKLFPVTRQPYTVFENADYVLDDESAITGTCTTASGSDLITVPYGDLLDRGIRPNDVITVVDGILEHAFTVIAIVDPATIRVSPFSTVTLTAASFYITRDVAGNFIRFVDGTFTKSVPAPDRFWAEVTFFDNNDSVENNFGVLVGVLRSDLSAVGATISYKNAVAGLMYALTNGPTIANLQLASQILLGLPFTTNAGTIVEIDPSFKTRADGSPMMGRILVAAEDVHGNPLGITNIYFYPQGRQVADPTSPGSWLPANKDLSGLAINPDTGEEYKIGDSVGQFAALSKGTQVQDYLSNPTLLQDALNQGNPSFIIQQYHSFQLTINADVTTAIDTDLVAQFIKKAKPTYTKLYLKLSKALEDEVSVEDSLLFARALNVDDNESLSLTEAASVDRQAADAGYVTTEGRVYAYMLAGTDLVTTQASLSVSSAAGGFVTARAFESHDGDFIRGNYLLKIRSGVNAGDYVVSVVNTDTSITVNSTDVDGNAFEFQTLTGQDFAIYKPIMNPVIEGMATYVQGSNTVNVAFGLLSPGVAVGDLLLFFDSVGLTIWSGIYVITAVDVANARLTLNKQIAETSGTWSTAIVREGLLTQHLWATEVATHVSINQVAGNSVISISSTVDAFISLACYPGDVIINPGTGEEFVIIDFDPQARFFVVSPPPLNTGTYAARLERPSRSSLPAGAVVSVDILDRIPGDFLGLTLSTRAVVAGGSGPDLTTTAASPTVGTVSGLDFNVDLGVIPGDYLVVLEGADRLIDIGYGAGIFPILAVSGVNLTLTRVLTTTNAAPGILFGIQRRRANER